MTDAVAAAEPGTPGKAPTLTPQGGGRRALRPVVPDVIGEHLDEIAFLNVQRRKLLFSPELPLSRLPAHDARIAAHHAGLVTAGHAAVELAISRFDEAFDPWDIYAAAYVWLELGTPGMAEVVERLAGADAELVPAWAEALRRVRLERLEAVFSSGPQAVPAGPAREALTFAWGWHGKLDGSDADVLYRSGDSGERRVLARALGWTPHTVPQHQALLQTLCSDAAPGVRAAALWSMALLAPQTALREAAAAIVNGTAAAFDVRLIGLLGSPANAPVLHELAGARGPLAPAALRALGDLGDPAAVEILIWALGVGDDALAEAGSDGLTQMLGSPPADGEEDADPWLASAEVLLAERQRVAPGYGVAPRLLHGAAVPWSGAPADEPMAWVWRASLPAPRQGIEWLRREVPDGFFTGEPCDVALAGE
jgi:hypothetical protein